MKYNFICGSCNNPLYEQGIVIKSEIGPLLMCSTCRALYYIDMVVTGVGVVLAITVLNLPPEQEYDIIRGSIDHIPFSEYLPKKPQEEKKIDINEVIASARTPTDLIRLLQYGK